MQLLEFIRELQKAAEEADERRAGVLVEMFENDRPTDYKRLLDVARLDPARAITALQPHYPIITTLIMFAPNWQTIVTFTQHAILLNEQHKQRRLSK